MNSCSLILAVDFLFSPRCQCPAQFEGPECQQNKHSFRGNGYAWFPPMMPCFESHVSLEFITDVDDGLLLYSGPLAQLQAWDHEDFMAIGRRHPELNNMPHLALIQNTSLFEDNCNWDEWASYFVFNWFNFVGPSGKCPQKKKKGMRPEILYEDRKRSRVWRVLRDSHLYIATVIATVHNWHIF